MLHRMLRRVVPVLSLVALTFLLVAGQARAQFRGRQQSNTAQPLSPTAVQRQQAGTQTTCQQAGTSTTTSSSITSSSGSSSSMDATAEKAALLQLQPALQPGL